MPKGTPKRYTTEQLRGHAEVLRDIASKLEEVIELLDKRGKGDLWIPDAATFPTGMKYVRNFSYNIRSAYDDMVTGGGTEGDELGERDDSPEDQSSSNSPRKRRRV